MIKEIIATGKDVNEAKENARAALGAGPLDDVNFEILHLGSKGIFGLIGVKPAQVRAYIELPDAPERRQREKKRDKRKDENKKPQNEGGAVNEKAQNEKKAETKKNEPKAKKEKAHSEVIPENELKLTKVDTTEGDLAYAFVSTVIGNMGIDASAELFIAEDGTKRIIISGTDAASLIGHHGDTLDALQYLTNLAGTRKNESGEKDKRHTTIDIEGYRAKREATLRALARRMAEKAKKNRRSIALEPMNAYERRIIHSEVQSIEGVSTNSIGNDNNRKVIIFLTDKKPKGVFEEENTDAAVVENNDTTVSE